MRRTGSFFLRLRIFVYVFFINNHRGSHSGKRGKREMLYAVAEQSLSGFLEDEPDLYSVADIRVRYR